MRPKLPLVVILRRNYTKFVDALARRIPLRGFQWTLHPGYPVHKGNVRFHDGFSGTADEVARSAEHPHGDVEAEVATRGYDLRA